MYTRVPASRDIFFLRARIGEGTLIDVGANVGLVTLLLADKVKHALLFEPNPVAAQRARENLALNGLKFEVHELALSDRTGTVAFEDEGGVSTCNRTVSGFSTSVPTREVRCIQLDEFLTQHPPPLPISAIKIDVEGHENQVLAGNAGMPAPVPAWPGDVRVSATDQSARDPALVRVSRVRCPSAHFKGPEIAGPDVPPLQDLFACPNELLQEITAGRRADG